LLTEQVRLLQERDALMSRVHAAVQQRWEEEEATTTPQIEPQTNDGN
jgi:hypothetical protein